MRTLPGHIVSRLHLKKQTECLLIKVEWFPGTVTDPKVFAAGRPPTQSLARIARPFVRDGPGIPSSVREIASEIQRTYRSDELRGYSTQALPKFLPRPGPGQLDQHKHCKAPG
jgi:hypothetical protein